MWWGFGEGGIGVQVLFAIGASMVAAVWLRRLSARVLAAAGVGLVLAGEAITGGCFWLERALGHEGRMPSLPTALLWTGGMFGRGALFVIYPLLPWGAAMVLGLAFGRWLEAGRSAARAARACAWLGAAALAVFLIVRGLNGYGNMLLYRDDGSLVQWLHVSKYPPSLSFMSLELGLMMVALAVCFTLQRGRARRGNPLLVFGQTALFFYLVHVHLLSLAAAATGLRHRLDLPQTCAVALLALAVLYPVCYGYRALKARYPRSALRYV
jgi:uncharacterized membrane protein